MSKLRDQKLMQDFDALIALNVRSPLFLTQLAHKALIEQKGCIVNVASIGSLVAAPMMLPYAMGKAALTSMTKSLAVDLGRKGVRVNEVK